MGKKYITRSGREIDLGIYGELSEEGVKALAKMLYETSPGIKGPKGKAAPQKECCNNEEAK